MEQTAKTPDGREEPPRDEGNEARPTPAAVTPDPWPDRCHWWIDAVGGLLVLRTPVVRVGCLGAPDAHVTVQAPLSRRQAEFLRDPGGIVVRNLAGDGDLSVNGQRATVALLRDGDVVRMRGVEWQFSQPVPWSTTAVLRLAGHHRLPLGLDGVLLLGETVVLGGPRAHHLPLPAAADVGPEGPAAVFVQWHRGGYWARGPADLRIDGRPCPAGGPLTPTSTAEGAWGSFRFEPA